MDGRIAARALHTLAKGVSVSLAGRVVAHGDKCFTLQDDTGCVEVGWPSAVPFGALVRALGEWNGHGVDARTLHIDSPGGERFARGDSDFMYLSGKRLANLRTRHAITRAIRDFFDAQDLLEVDTPAIVPCPGLDVHLDAVEVLGAGGARWLHTSPEYQMKRLLSTCVPGIYQLGKAFRRGERGRLHEQEFAMLEWYRSFADAEAMMRDTEALVQHVAKTVLDSTIIAGSSQAVDVSEPWERLRVADAFERYAGVKLENVLPDEERFYRVLVEKVEPELGRGKPTFLTHYPARMASLAKVYDEEPAFAERFEAYVDGVEICNGFSELTDAAEQRKRLQQDQATRQKLGRSVYPLDERFLAALDDGIPPSGGNALGLDRLAMLMIGAKHIDEVIAFPAART